MSSLPPDHLLARLITPKGDSTDAEPWSRLAATQPNHQGPVNVTIVGPDADTAEAEEPGETLDQLCNRISNLVRDKSPGAAPPIATAFDELVEDATNNFVPLEPETLEKAQLTESQVEDLILKLLLNRGVLNGRAMADHLRLPFKLVDQVLRSMKTDQLVVYKNSAAMGDYDYMITDAARERGRRLFDHCTYFGSAPVSLQDYINSVRAQSMTNQHPTASDLEGAFSDLLLNKRMLDRLGPAINSGRGLFLYGAPGNGKTSIAERMTRAFGQVIWLPRALGIEGEIIRLFDPMNHEELPLKANEGLLDTRPIDKRWVRIRRPTIIVGGELTMDSLEISINRQTGISEAPLQLKSNCGTLVIDDFGRQKMRTDELLNRWIVPLEKRHDYLNMASGKKIQVPFDQLIVFSTNLEPKQLVDDAFLRRIPYKIDVPDPSETEFRELFHLMAPKLGFEHRDEPIDYLIDRYYLQTGRPFRCCQPRDLLLQVRNFCFYQDRPLELTSEYFDYAVSNYFAVM